MLSGHRVFTCSQGFDNLRPQAVFHTKPAHCQATCDCCCPVILPLLCEPGFLEGRAQFLGRCGRQLWLAFCNLGCGRLGAKERTNCMPCRTPRPSPKNLHPSGPVGRSPAPSYFEAPPPRPRPRGRSGATPSAVQSALLWQSSPELVRSPGAAAPHPHLVLACCGGGPGEPRAPAPVRGGCHRPGLPPFQFLPPGRPQSGEGGYSCRRPPPPPCSAPSRVS